MCLQKCLNRKLLKIYWFIFKFQQIETMRFYQNENGLEIDLIMDFDSNYKFCFKIVSDVAQAKADLMAFRK